MFRRLESCCHVLGSRHCNVLAHILNSWPSPLARHPSTAVYWQSTLRPGSVRLNFIEDASAPFLFPYSCIIYLQYDDQPGNLFWRPKDRAQVKPAPFCSLSWPQPWPGPVKFCNHSIFEFHIAYFAEKGTRSWFGVLVFTCSWPFRNANTKNTLMWKNIAH